MVLIQINIPEKLDKKLSIYKILRNLVTKEEAIIELLVQYFNKNPTWQEHLTKEEKGDSFEKNK